MYHLEARTSFTISRANAFQITHVSMYVIILYRSDRMNLTAYTQEPPEHIGMDDSIE